MANSVYEKLLKNLTETNFYTSTYDQIPQIIPFGMENTYVGQYHNVSDDTQYPLTQTTHNLALLADELNQLSITEQNSSVASVISDTTTNYSNQAIMQTTLDACEEIIENAPEGTDKETLYKLCGALLSGSNNQTATIADDEGGSITGGNVSSVIPECARADRLATTWFAIAGIVAKIRSQGGHNIWNEYITYDKNAPVRDKYGVYYKSLADSNRGHNPMEASSKTYWERTTFPDENYNQRNGNWFVAMQDNGRYFNLTSRAPFLNYLFTPAKLYDGYKISFVALIDGVDYSNGDHYTISIDGNEYPFYAEGINKTGFNGYNIKAGQLINCYYYSGAFYGLNLNENAIDNGYKVGDLFFSMYKRTQEENEFESILCDGRLLQNSPLLDSATELHKWLQTLPQDQFYNTLEEWQNAKKISAENPFGQVMKMYYEPALMYNYSLKVQYYGFSNVETLYCYKDTDVTEDKRYYIKDAISVDESKKEQIKVYDSTGIYLGLGVVEYGILFYEGISYERYTESEADLSIGANFYTSTLTSGAVEVYQRYYNEKTKTYFHKVGTGTLVDDILKYDSREYNRKDSLDEIEENSNVYTKTRAVGTYEVFQYNYNTEKFEDTGEKGTITYESTTKNYILTYLSIKYTSTHNNKTNGAVLGLPCIKNITTMTGNELKLANYLQQEAIPTFYGLTGIARYKDLKHIHGIDHTHPMKHTHPLTEATDYAKLLAGSFSTESSAYYASGGGIAVDKGSDLLNRGYPGYAYSKWTLTETISQTYTNPQTPNGMFTQSTLKLNGNTGASSIENTGASSATSSGSALENTALEIDYLFSPGDIGDNEITGEKRGAYISSLYGLQTSACVGYWYLKAKTHTEERAVKVLKFIGLADKFTSIDNDFPDAVNGDVVLVKADQKSYVCHETSSGKEWLEATSLIDFSYYCPVPVGCWLETYTPTDFSKVYPNTTWELDAGGYADWVTGDTSEAGQILKPILPKLPSIKETSHSHNAGCSTNGNHNHNVSTYVTGHVQNRASGTEWNAQQGTATIVTTSNGDHNHTITIEETYHTHEYEEDANGIYGDGDVVRPTCRAKLRYIRTS